jgi:hypothetical protein
MSNIEQGISKCGLLCGCAKSCKKKCPTPNSQCPISRLKINSIATWKLDIKSWALDILAGLPLPQLTSIFAFSPTSLLSGKWFHSQSCHIPEYCYRREWCEFPAQTGEAINRLQCSNYRLCVFLLLQFFARVYS